MTTLEAQVRRLEDLEEIRRLKHTYALLVDRMPLQHTAADEEALVDLFTADAVADFGARVGVFSGQPAIRAFYTQALPGQRSWFMHYLANPVIDVDGDRAHAQWMVTALTQGKGQPPAPATQVTGRYIDNYVRTAAGWRIARQRFVDESRG